jgi:TolB-like protein/Flp pilus assembly protein TadD
MSLNSDRAYLSDGITEELIHALAGVENLRVIARSSVIQFKGKPIDIRDAAEQLGVAHILEGSVRSSGDRLRITVRLVSAQRGDELWSQVFDTEETDILAVQSEIASAVVTALRVKLGGDEQFSLTSQADPRAHALYLKGQRLFHGRKELDHAVRFFREAIAIDPRFAQAWTGLSRTWLIMPVYTAVPFPEALDSAETAIKKALTLDPNLADAHATLGSMMTDDWRWAASEPHFVRALELRGGDATTHQWYGEMLFRVGRIDEAIERMKAAEQLNPLQSAIPMVLGWAYLASDRREDALIAFREAVALDPRDVQAHIGIGYSLLAVERYTEAIHAFEKAVELTDGQRSTRAHLARAYALAGRQSEATTILEELRTQARSGSGSAWAVAVVAVSLGLEDEALRWLEEGYRRREIGIGYLKMSEAFKPLRSNPRFVELLRKIGL